MSEIVTKEFNLVEGDYLSQFQNCELFKQVRKKEEKNQILRVFSLAQKRLKKADEVFYHYTAHDIGHAIRTLEAMCKILVSSKILRKLSNSEIHLAICSSLLHDVGMGPLSNDEIGMTTSVDGTREDISEWRSRHNERVFDWIINEQVPELSHLSLEERRKLAHICRAHRKINLIHDPYLRKNPDIAFLGALLRLADQMDLSPDRLRDRLVERPVLKHMLREAITPEAEIQIREFLKSFTDKEWYLEFQENGNALVLKSRIEIDELTVWTLEALHELTYDIETAIEETKNVEFRRISVLPRRLLVSFSVEREASNSHELRADYSRVWDYLNVYLYPKENKTEIVIREAITNALDACNIQLQYDQNSSCCVEVKVSKDKIEIKDDGCGMPLEIIEDHLKVLGSSYYDSAAFQGNPFLSRNERIPIIGQFGIGVFSYLLLCDYFEITTTTEVGSTYRILFSKRFGVTIELEDSSDYKRGTVLTLPKPRTVIVGIWDDFDRLKKIICETFVFPSTLIKIENEVESYIHSGKDFNSIRKLVIDESKLRLHIEEHLSDEFGKYGLEIQSEIPVGNMIDNISDILELHYKLIPMSRNLGHFSESVFYEGMLIKNANLEITPFLVGLFGIMPHDWKTLWSTRKGVISTYVNYRSGTVSLNLPKMNLYEKSPIQIFGQFEKKIDKLAMNQCLWLLEHPDVSSSIKETMRFLITQSLSSAEYAYLEGLGTPDRIFESILADVICVDSEKLEFLRFRDLLEYPKDSRLIIRPRMRLFEFYRERGLFARILVGGGMREIFRRKDATMTAAREGRKEFMKNTNQVYSDYNVIFIMAGSVTSSLGGTSRFFKEFLEAKGFSNVSSG